MNCSLQLIAMTDHPLPVFSEYVTAESIVKPFQPPEMTEVPAGHSA
jgi:hypothetical protein